MRWTLP